MRNNQLIYFRLARLQTKIELLNTLAYEGDEAYADGPDVTRKISMECYNLDGLSARLSIVAYNIEVTWVTCLTTLLLVDIVMGV
jgi:hypothetical protein